jgi:predicted TIM-barrel fold metal-dependent hydrolase
MIDLHVHLHPPRLFAAIRRWFAERSTWRLEHPTEPQKVSDVLRAHGVWRFVFCSYAHRAGMARSLNGWLTQTASELRGHGLPLATIHLDDAEYLEDLERALRDGCVGLKIHEDVQHLLVDDERFTPVYERLGEEGLVLAHVGAIPWQAATGGIARVERVLRRHPKVRFVVAHMGGADAVAYLLLSERYPNLYLDTTMAFAKASPMSVDLDAQLIEWHADQILYGTDYPNIPYAYDDERRGIEALGLSPGARRKILRDNAARLLRLV